MSDMSKLYETVETTRKLLAENPEWRKRYKKYAEVILEKQAFIESIRESFRAWKPFTFYLNITSIKNAKGSVKFDMRYHGQNVAELVGDSKGWLVGDSKGRSLDTSKFNKQNKEHFNCDICLPDVAWSGEEARKFRRYFKNEKPARKGNNEHRIESLLLTAFSKNKDKSLRYIRPVLIAKTRFPMPTPISASDIKKPIAYAGSSGGGIDLLARTGQSPNTELCVIELKDENKRTEPPVVALKQAIAYATFIRELLRSNSGKIWWKLFGFDRELPDELTIRVACAMPSNENNDYSFTSKPIPIGQDTEDAIELHYIYLAEKDNVIAGIETSLPGNPK